MSISSFFDEIDLPEEAGNFTYILQCKDGSFYTGWTNDLAKRLKAHNEGTGAKYTKARGPVRLVYFESFEDKIQAMKREAAIKKLTRGQKEALVLNKYQRE